MTIVYVLLWFTNKHLQENCFLADSFILDDAEYITSLSFTSDLLVKREMRLIFHSQLLRSVMCLGTLMMKNQWSLGFKIKLKMRQMFVLDAKM